MRRKLRRQPPQAACGANFGDNRYAVVQPLRIDVVIVKKLKNVPIKKSIAAIFRKYNLIEYKSPSDYISIEDFYKVHAYACLYVIVEPRTVADIAELTITFVGSHHPRKLVEHLVEVHHYAVEKPAWGSTV
ncbi:MAG: hypothetical protein LBF83_05145 [Spirochaetaceae bacterium]|nr:hypothetical protein [Spirochaetaceae bacterium]